MYEATFLGVSGRQLLCDWLVQISAGIQAGYRLSLAWGTSHMPVRFSCKLKFCRLATFFAACMTCWWVRGDVLGFCSMYFPPLFLYFWFYFFDYCFALHVYSPSHSETPRSGSFELSVLCSCHVNSQGWLQHQYLTWLDTQLVGQHSPRRHVWWAPSCGRKGFFLYFHVHW